MGSCCPAKSADHAQDTRGIKNKNGQGLPPPPPNAKGGP